MESCIWCDSIKSSHPCDVFLTDCGLIESPADGSVTYSNSATTYQEVATFSCDIGFDLIGDTSRTCMDDGMWGGASPVCQIKGKVYFNVLFHALLLPEHLFKIHFFGLIY